MHDSSRVPTTWVGSGRPGATDSRWRVLLGCVVWAALHSALAAQPAKTLARHVVGLRLRNGCYRFLYVVGSTALVLGFVRWFQRLPDRQVYRIGPPWSWLLHAVQVLSLGWLCWGVAAVGLGQATGVRQAWTLLHGGWPEREPEDQGPTVVDGQAVCHGPYRWSRHPNNLVALAFFWLMPRMTVNRAMLAATASIYAVLGSVHEELRLLRAYGPAYRNYQRQVPFLLPRPHRALPRRHTGDQA